MKRKINRLDKSSEPTGTFNLHGGERSALGQVGGVEAQEETQVPLRVDERRGKTAEVRSSDGLLVRLSRKEYFKIKNLT